MSEVLIRSYESGDQSEVEDLYRNGMNAYAHIPIICDCTKWFVEDKLKIGGDMHDIQAYYMNNNSNIKRHFWVALSNNKIVGCVGVIPSTTYSEEYAELVRMSVSSACRNMGIGTKLLNKLVEWSKNENYKFINLSTLKQMNLAMVMYQRNGFILDKEIEFDISSKINADSPVMIQSVYFIKEL